MEKIENISYKVSIQLNHEINLIGNLNNSINIKI